MTIHETITEGIEALRARHASELAEMDKQLQLAEQLVPLGLPSPKRIMFADKPNQQPWIIYDGMTRAAAAGLLSSWEPFIAPQLFAVADGCLYVDVAQREKGTLRWQLESPVALDFSSGSGFSTVELYWYAVVADRTVRCKVNLQSGEYGHCADWPHPRPYVRVEYDRYGNPRRNEMPVKSYPILGENERVQWGSGSDDSIYATYFYARTNRDALLVLLKGSP